MSSMATYNTARAVATVQCVKHATAKVTSAFTSVVLVKRRDATIAVPTGIVLAVARYIVPIAAPRQAARKGAGNGSVGVAIRLLVMNALVQCVLVVKTFSPVMHAATTFVILASRTTCELAQVAEVEVVKKISKPMSVAHVSKSFALIAIRT